MRASGRQYRIEPDQTFDVDSLSADVGSTVELNEVLLLAGNGEVRVGTPTLDGVRVIAEVIEHGRGKKIIVYKQKSKTRYRRKKGHRQGFTRLTIRQIVTGAEEAEPETPKKKPARPAPSAETTAEATIQTPVAEPAVEQPAAEAKPARRTRARKAPEEKQPDAPNDADKKADGN
ncbi:MAG: 50S ribosomal protein L21 [Dehalococcoidia bacterium]